MADTHRVTSPVGVCFPYNHPKAAISEVATGHRDYGGPSPTQSVPGPILILSHPCALRPALARGTLEGREGEKNQRPDPQKTTSENVPGRTSPCDMIHTSQQGYQAPMTLLGRLA